MNKFYVCEMFQQMMDDNPDYKKFKNIKRRKQTRPWWYSDVTYAFNFPAVAAYLEQLMGNSLVKLTNRKYMTKLHERIVEDHSETLRYRCRIRMGEEVERELEIILEPREDIKNFSDSIFQAQSVVLKKDLEEAMRDREFKDIKYAKTIREHPIVAVNRKTNVKIMKKRAKLKTARQKKSAKILKIGKRHEKRVPLMEHKDLIAEFNKKAREEIKIQKEFVFIDDFPDEIPQGDVLDELLKIKDKRYTKDEEGLFKYMLEIGNVTKDDYEESSRDSFAEKLVRTQFYYHDPSLDKGRKVKMARESFFDPRKKEYRDKVEAQRNMDPRLRTLDQLKNFEDIYDLTDDLFLIEDSSDSEDSDIAEETDHY